MRTLDHLPALADRASSDAQDAASRAGIEIAAIEDLDAIRAASTVFAEIWGTNGNDDQLPPELLRALTHAGNYAAGAYAEGQLVGAVVGFLGREDDETYLHSHILGVSLQRRGSNVGFALKQHQRAWALANGISKVTWTFDPLVRRNAHFNLQKLGASASAYYENFYGRMRDAVNAGDETDRLLVVWQLDDDRAELAASGTLEEPAGPDGAATAGPSVEEGDVLQCITSGDLMFCATPPDILSLRRSDPDAAHRWRLALREGLGSAMRDGYGVRGFTRSGWYVLKRDGSSA